MSRWSVFRSLPLVGLSLVLLALGLAWMGWALAFREGHSTAVEDPPRHPVTLAAARASLALPGQARPGQARPSRAWELSTLATVGDDESLRLLVEQLALQLLERHGQTIADKRVQADLLELRQSLVSRFGERGLAMFEQVIARAFPDLAEEILATVAAMVIWEDWLAENRLALDAMTPLERHGLLWQKRRELFGADAEAIWAEELQALAARQQAVREVMATLDQSFDSSINEKLYQLQSSLQDIYGGSTEGLVLENSVVAQVFFGFESVQQTLRELPPEQRQAEINRVRRQLGYGEEQIERLALRDAVRNARWENGLAYMEARRRLPLVNGAPREEDLERLRQDYFQQEARTITLEEEDGFFRFERPRIHGRN